jgi:hypothetical protein
MTGGGIGLGRCRRSDRVALSAGLDTHNHFQLTYRPESEEF